MPRENSDRIFINDSNIEELNQNPEKFLGYERIFIHLEEGAMKFGEKFFKSIGRQYSLELPATINGDEHCHLRKILGLPKSKPFLTRYF